LERKYSGAGMKEAGVVVGDVSKEGIVRGNRG